jgi:tetratricopeptide (TPR) repeat protein
MSEQKQREPAPQETLDQIGDVASLIVLNIKSRVARCMLEGTGYLITFRSSETWDLEPGQIIEVATRKAWMFKGHPYLSGEVRSKRIDVAALGLEPLALEPMGDWDPAKEYWLAEDEPMVDWEQIIAGAGPRPMFEMEQIIPGDDPETEGPILAAIDLAQGGDPEGASEILYGLLEADLRCLDAYCHLGNLHFDNRPEMALDHYRIGMGIGELSLPEKFNGVLHWGFIDNRPFLRCVHGAGLCLWRLKRFDEAKDVFERLLWMSPADQLGVRFVVDEVAAHKIWQPD